MKMLAVVSTIDLRYRMGCTPAWWQLLKALYETENEIIVVPYLGRDIETVWWRTYPNPWRMPGELYVSLARKAIPKRAGRESRFREGLAYSLTQIATLPVWRRYLRRILTREKDVDALMFFNVPLNQITGIATEVKREFGIKTVYYDGDMPTILPEHNVHRGFMFDYYRGARLDEYDVFFVNSEGVIKNLEERGARHVTPLHYAADPDLFQPIPAEKRWDVAFFGYGSEYREKWMTRMIAEPSMQGGSRFIVGGEGFGIPLGKSTLAGDVPFSAFRRFCNSARVNLNITRESHTSIYASSTARPFELAAMGCAIVSCPYNGLDQWFEQGKEMSILKEGDDVLDVYSNLLANEELLSRMGRAARERVLRDHTYTKRAMQLCEDIRRTS